jgi:hypothetical protein
MQKGHIGWDLKIGHWIWQVGKHQQSTGKQYEWGLRMEARWQWVEKGMGGDEVETARVQITFSRVLVFFFLS